MNRRDDDVELGRALQVIASWADPIDIPPLEELTPSLAGHAGSVDAHSKRRWWVAAAAALVVLASAAVWAAVSGSEDSSPQVGTVPDGWQDVLVGSAQFSVPGDWPVFDDSCDEPDITRGVLILRPGQCDDSFGFDEFTVYAGPGQFDVDAEIDAVENPPVDGTAPLQTQEMTTLNGLRAIISRPLACATCGYRGVKLLDEGVAISLQSVPGEDDLAERIIATIRPADQSQIGQAFTIEPADPARDIVFTYLPPGFSEQYDELGSGGNLNAKPTGTTRGPSGEELPVLGPVARVQLLADAAAADSIAATGSPSPESAVVVVTVTPTADIREDYIQQLLERGAARAPIVIGGDDGGTGQLLTSRYLIEANGRGVDTAQLSRLLSGIQIG